MGTNDTRPQQETYLIATGRFSSADLTAIADAQVRALFQLQTGDDARLQTPLGTGDVVLLLGGFRADAIGVVVGTGESGIGPTLYAVWLESENLTELYERSELLYLRADDSDAVGAYRLYAAEADAERRRAAQDQPRIAAAPTPDSDPHWDWDAVVAQREGEAEDASIAHEQALATERSDAFSVDAERWAAQRADGLLDR